MKLPELEDDDKNAKKLRLEKLLEIWKDIKEVLHYQHFPHIPKIICLKLISMYHNDTFPGHFGIQKTQELIACKYYWLTLQKDVNAYVNYCDNCLASKTVCYKPYRDLQLLYMSTY